MVVACFVRRRVSPLPHCVPSLLSVCAHVPRACAPSLTLPPPPACVCAQEAVTPAPTPAPVPSTPAVAAEPPPVPLAPSASATTVGPSTGVTAATPAPSEGAPPFLPAPGCFWLLDPRCGDANLSVCVGGLYGCVYVCGVVRESVREHTLCDCTRERVCECVVPVSPPLPFPQPLHQLLEESPSPTWSL